TGGRKERGFTAVLQERIAGVPVHNVLTGTTGFRRPGYYVTVEPGLVFSTSLANYTVSAPLRVQAGTRPNFLGSPISSDFTHYTLVFSVSFKFGGNRKPAADLGVGSPEAKAAAGAEGKKA